ncbi:MAG TPA: helix-turn-helix transcriptional regulator [Solirubrobacteraceae bacterium]|nr:helix-turn-helix transcriptional regulator [Solirubrobacteraceae bacterium]
MPPARVRSRCTRQLELLADSTLDVDSLRLEAIGHLRQAIGFDLWCSPLVDPDTLIPHRPVVSDALPFGSCLPRLLVQDQSGEEINSRAMLARAPDNVCMLSAATGRDLARSRRWRDCAQPAGVGDELRAAVVDDRGCWASFELYRASDDPTFDAEDAQLMRDAARILARRLRQSSVSATADGGVDPGQTGVLLMDDDLQPQGFTQTAREWFALLKAREKADHAPLPTHVYAVVGRLLAAEAGDDPKRPPRVRVRTGEARWAIIEAARLEGAANAIAVTVREAGAEDVLSLLARAHGLTARERELVGLVLEGLDTRQLAGRMFISPYTVKDHLKSVFNKLGVHSRRELVTGMFGQLRA